MSTFIAAGINIFSVTMQAIGSQEWIWWRLFSPSSPESFSLLFWFSPFTSLLCFAPYFLFYYNSCNITLYNTYKINVASFFQYQTSGVSSWLCKMEVAAQDPLRKWFKCFKNRKNLYWAHQAATDVILNEYVVNARLLVNWDRWMRTASVYCRCPHVAKDLWAVCLLHSVGPCDQSWIAELHCWSWRWNQ